MNSVRKTTGMLLTAMALTWLTSCLRQTVYYHYEHTPITGWEKNDVLEYSVAPMTDDCTLREEVMMRANRLYPFQTLTVVLEQEVLPRGLVRRDTLNISIFDKQGIEKGRGTSLYSFMNHLTDLQLARGDSLHILLHHNMKREILPGIADVGIMLRKQ